MTTQTATFEMNGKTYKTDAETVKVLRMVVPRAKASGDVSAVTAVMGLGLKAGRIVEDTKPAPHTMTRKEWYSSLGWGELVSSQVEAATRVGPSEHRRFVERAVAAEMPVAAEVLADYPDLAAVANPKPCKHPASRQYAWHAYNHLTDKVDALCICCCDCGAVLKGGATLASEEAQS